MKTFSIRTLLILISVCGCVYWYLFVPVCVPAIVTQEDTISLGDRVELFRLFNPDVKIPRVAWHRLGGSDDFRLGNPSGFHGMVLELPAKQHASVAVSRWQYLSFQGDEIWIAYPMEKDQ